MGRFGFGWSKGCLEGCGSGWGREIGECQVLGGSLGASHGEGSLLFTLDLCYLQQVCFTGELQVAVMCRMELKERGLQAVAVIQVRENGHHAGEIDEGR